MEGTVTDGAAQTPSDDSRAVYGDSLTDDDLVFMLYRVARLATCWCTEPKYWKKGEPTTCLRCLAMVRVELERPDLLKRFA